MRSILAASIVLSMLLPAAFPQAAKKLGVDAKPPIVARQFDLHNVRLLAGPLKENLERNQMYLLSLEVNRLVHNFRVNAGLPSKAQPLGGWEAPNCELRGHFTGHYLSACALMFASTGDVRVEEKGNQVVDGLLLAKESLMSRKDGQFMVAKYPIPEELIRG
jgi:hypothetical protein